MKIEELPAGLLKQFRDDDWPVEFIEAIGSFEEDPLEVPEELPWSSDSKRESWD